MIRGLILSESLELWVLNMISFAKKIVELATAEASLLFVVEFETTFRFQKN